MDNKAPVHNRRRNRDEHPNGTGSEKELIERGEQLKRDGIVIRT